MSDFYNNYVLFKQIVKEGDKSVRNFFKPTIH